jgi:hypothetical protein
VLIGFAFEGALFMRCAGDDYRLAVHVQLHVRGARPANLSVARLCRLREN